MPLSESRVASGLELSAPGRTPLPALVVFSHLRWDMVVRRPQHLLTRLAKDFRVFFVEEPILCDGSATLAASHPAPGVEVLTPRTPVAARGFHDEQLPVLESLLAEFVAERRLDDPFAWLTTPMALPLAADLEPRAVIYDCADDFATNASASRLLVQREEALLALADVVLTASPALHELRRAGHPNLHCLPSAVDAEHFARPPSHRLECAAARALHEGLPRPRLGFFGAIDGRLDLALVAAIADQRPGWQLVMVGPVDEGVAAALPRWPNIRWLGAQSYDMLPHLLSHWDVCLLPLVLGDATRFASPAQTLEYLAGGKPVVATALADVASLYGKVVLLAGDNASFIEAVDAVLAERPALREQRRVQAQAFVDARSWDGTAALIGELLGEFVRPAPAHPPADLPRVPVSALLAGGASQPVQARSRAG